MKIVDNRVIFQAWLCHQLSVLVQLYCLGLLIYKIRSQTRRSYCSECLILSQVLQRCLG